jgi:hypothetical protein
MSGSSLIVAVNAIALKRLRLPGQAENAPGVPPGISNDLTAQSAQQ